MIDLRLGDCKEVLKSIPDSSVDLILTDPPYYKVKGEAWDRQWDTPKGFLDWLDSVLVELSRVLRPNGSLYLFASPQMSARVEVLIGSRFNVLNNIRWVKEAGWHNKTEKEALRSFLSPFESVIFAEHYGSDGYAKGEAGYSAKVDELRGFIFEPIRAYLAGERDRAGLTTQKIDEAWQFQRKTKGQMAGHWFGNSQWAIPTKENYQWLRETMSRLNHGGEYLKKDYEELKKDYEELKKDYEELRRPFSVSADVPYTDTWTFKTVPYYKGKHPCEKPLDMLEHIINSSSKEGAVVLDCFAGTGNTGKAAKKLNRKFIGIEKDPAYFQIAKRRIEEAQLELSC